MLILTFVISVLITVVTSYITYNSFTDYVENENRQSAIYYASELIVQNDLVLNDEILKNESKRVTVINKSGKVIYDNSVEIKTLDNHSNRPEIIQAKKERFGESRRFSNTLSKETYYYAIEVNNGYVIRSSITTDTVISIYAQKYFIYFITIVIVFIICNIFAYMLSKRIAKSIDEYEEVSPYLSKIESQKIEIAHKDSEMESKLRTMKLITDNMVEGLAIIDNDNNLISINKKLRNILEINDNVEHKNILEIFRNYDLYEILLNNLDSQRTVKIDNMYYNVVTNKIIVDSVFIGKIILFIDTTKKEKANIIRKEFSANVSHELKTPLSSILGYSELLENELVDISKQKDFLAKIKTEALNMDDLINDILFLSNLDELDKELEMKEESVSEIINVIIERLRPLISDKNLVVNLDVKCSVLTVNYRLMYEAIYNLVENAIKYNYENGYINIVVNESELIIENSGETIAMDQQDRIFERFYRIEKSRNRSMGGYGLGLAIVKHAILLQGGSINVKSSNNVTVFTVRI